MKFINVLGKAFALALAVALADLSRPFPDAVDAPTGGKTFLAALPPDLAAVPVRDGGQCYLDAINDIPIRDNAGAAKSGALFSIVGWSIVEAPSGTLGSAVVVQLAGARQQYFVVAQAYKRPGLGAALGNPSLDGGGVLLRGVRLSLPAGEYRLHYMMQTKDAFVRCDSRVVVEVH